MPIAFAIGSNLGKSPCIDATVTAPGASRLGMQGPGLTMSQSNQGGFELYLRDARRVARNWREQVWQLVFTYLREPLEEDFPQMDDKFDRDTTLPRQ